MIYKVWSVYGQLVFFGANGKLKSTFVVVKLSMLLFFGLMLSFSIARANVILIDSLFVITSDYDAQKQAEIISDSLNQDSVWMVGIRHPFFRIFYKVLYTNEPVKVTLTNRTEKVKGRYQYMETEDDVLLIKKDGTKLILSLNNVHLMRTNYLINKIFAGLSGVAGVLLTREGLYLFDNTSGFASAIGVFVIIGGVTLIANVPVLLLQKRISPENYYFQKVKICKADMGLRIQTRWAMNKALKKKIKAEKS